MRSLVTTFGASDGEVICRFTHPFFTKSTRLKTGSFRYDHDQQTALYLARFDMSGLETAVPLSALARDLGLDENVSPLYAADAAMIGMVRRAVLYVERVRLDDPLPSEAVSGEASWQPAAAQRWAARESLRVRVAHWVKGGGRPALPPTREELTKLASHLTAASLDKALARGSALMRLDIAPDEVEHSVAALARGLAYILALRDRLAGVLASIETAIGAAGMLFPTDEEVAEVSAGLTRACKQLFLRLSAELDAAEAELDDIAACLRRPEPALVRLAGRRNAMHAELLRIEAIVEPWRSDAPGHGRDQRERLFETYRVLARRDLPGTRWLTMEERYAQAFGSVGAALKRQEPSGNTGVVPAGMAWLWN